MKTNFTNIIILSPLSISEKLIADFYMREMSEEFQLEYWDFSLTYAHMAHSHPSKLPRDLNFPVKTIEKLINLEKALEKNKKALPDTLYIVMATYNYSAMHVFKLLTKYQVSTAVFARGMVPTVKLTGSVTSRLKWLISLFSRPQKMLQVALNILALHNKKTGRVRPHDIVFQAGEMGIHVVGLGAEMEKNTAHIIKINHFDYDKYLEIKDSASLYPGRYAVFLDDCLPGHPDTKLFKIQTVEPNEYYHSLTSFFDFIEKEHNVNVIIAAHPKADYTMQNPFNGRQIIYGQTASLVKDSLFTIAHLSTSISFAVLFRKPIFFITNDPIQNLKQKNIPLDILGLADALGRKVINTDVQKNTADFSFDIDEEKYVDYIYKYLSSKESEAKRTIDIVFDFFRKGQKPRTEISTKKQPS